MVGDQEIRICVVKWFWNAPLRVQYARSNDPKPSAQFPTPKLKVQSKIFLTYASPVRVELEFLTDRLPIQMNSAGRRITDLYYFLPLMLAFRLG